MDPDICLDREGDSLALFTLIDVDRLSVLRGRIREQKEAPDIAAAETLPSEDLVFDGLLHPIL
jgi:hypothetical protein